MQQENGNDSGRQRRKSSYEEVKAAYARLLAQGRRVFSEGYDDDELDDDDADTSFYNLS